MPNRFGLGQVVGVADGPTQREVWTAPPNSKSYSVDVPDGTRGRVAMIWIGGTIYSVALDLILDGQAHQVFGAFAESELSG